MIYPQILGSDFARMPAVLRGLHTRQGRTHATGTATVVHTSSTLARWTGFFPAGEQIPVDLVIEASADREVWVRRFDGVTRTTVQRCHAGLLHESIGPLHMWFRIAAERNGMRFELVRARMFGIPIRMRVDARTRGESETSWEFEVAVARVGWYRGVMVLDS